MCCGHPRPRRGQQSGAHLMACADGWGPYRVVLGCDCILRTLARHDSATRARLSALLAANHVVGFAHLWRVSTPCMSTRLYRHCHRIRASGMNDVNGDARVWPPWAGKRQTEKINAALMRQGGAGPGRQWQLVYFFFFRWRLSWSTAFRSAPARWSRPCRAGSGQLCPDPGPTRAPKPRKAGWMWRWTPSPTALP